MEHVLGNEYFWLILSFIGFVWIIIRYGTPAINALLDGRIETIRKDIETAENLRIEAQEMLAQYQRKQRDAIKEADRIITDAQASARQFQDKMEQELVESMQRREEQLKQRLTRMEQDALQDVQSRAARIALAAARHAITEKLDKKDHAALVEQSIKDIEKVNIH